MRGEKKLTLSLFLLRVSVFVVMLMWTLDKFFRPEHASLVYQVFYAIPSFGAGISYLIGAIEMSVILGFLFGYKKTFTYGAVFLLHAISTLSSYKQYLAPFQEGNLLFFAAWPMLAACFALFLLRDRDTFLSVD
ncbi:MAG: hypothetical protein K940chlam7_00232 [Chlamydiae bacterium]|nr:hypothetical protein [Chlamydiota bacterium]